MPNQHNWGCWARGRDRADCRKLSVCLPVGLSACLSVCGHCCGCVGDGGGEGISARVEGVGPTMDRAPIMRQPSARARRVECPSRGGRSQSPCRTAPCGAVVSHDAVPERLLVAERDQINRKIRRN
ncbi:unnamed protein product [Protopolystoma xenopodis]|uniref:Uncharacterized protein n=1 Tax=Protopolystoma xenopodis TaxID=117903 RepID=A0A448XJA9_9PLAT|nr:unnamed protein product [Protopolystoma xenopodis]